MTHWKADVDPLRRAVDLDLGESQSIILCDGSEAAVRLVGLREERDSVCSAVRQAIVTVEVNGEQIDLISATYHLPVAAGGVQIDCPVTKGYAAGSRGNPWALLKDARLRLWPAGLPWTEPDLCGYPLRQRWFASATQMANEPTYVDGVESPGRKRIYYHNGLDFGGAEGLVETVAVCEALVVSAGSELLPGHESTPVRMRADVVYLLDRRGWYHRHSHLKAIDPAVRPGRVLARGDVVGVLGKEGASGGWSHLHYDLTARQPSGEWGTEEAYAFAWQAYQAEHSPKLIAVARPHRVAWSGEPVSLDGFLSWSAFAGPLDYDWTFTDGTSDFGPLVERTYPKGGVYSEVLKVTDGEGRTEYDFAIVQVADRRHPEHLAPGIHAAYAPTTGIGPGDPITFKVRSFGTTYGCETWDFGDGSAPVEVQSDGNADVWAPDGYAETVHAFRAPGQYVVSVRRTNEHGLEAIAHLHVRVGGEG